MRRLGPAFLLLIAMALLHRLTAAAPVAGRATLALGFLVAAALVLGAWAESFGVPAVTAYLGAGFALGPSWLGLIRHDEVAALGFTADLGTAVVAVIAGAALRLDALSLQRRPMLRMLGATALFPAALVTLVMVALARWFPPTAHEPFGDRLAVALVVGAAAVASASTLALATVERETEFTQVTLGLNVSRDLLAALLVAAILIVAPVFTSLGAVDRHEALGPLTRITASLVSGIAVAFAGSRLARTGRVAPSVAPVAMVATVALLARLVHVDPVLTGLTAGVCFNAWAGHAVLGLGASFEAIRAPVYAVTFGLLGAGLDLVDTADLWGWVFLVVVVRAVGLSTGWRRVQALAPHGWVGLISQSGTILWLAAGARHAFPEWGVSLRALIVGVVAVNALLGPLAYRGLLRQVDPSRSGA